MPKTDKREYRSLELGFGDEENGYRVTGHASTFDRYKLFEIETEDGIEEIFERIDRHAFDECDMSDVIFQLDHQGRVYARTKNDTVALNIDDSGLAVDVDLSRTSASRGVYEDIHAGNYSQMSFSFIPGESHIERSDDGTRTIVHDSIRKIYDVSAVGFPANPYTDISASMRDLIHGEMEKEKAERLDAEARAKERKRLQLRIRIGGFLNGNQ